MIGERHKDGSRRTKDDCRRAHAWMLPQKTLEDVAAARTTQPTPIGWCCPKCDAVNAPFVAQCSCSTQTGFAPLVTCKPQGETSR